MAKINSTVDTRGIREPNEDSRVMDDFFNDSNPFDIGKLPKLDGMTLQWHRVSTLGDNDTKNIMKSMSRGWKPVLMETLKEAATEGGFDMPYMTTKFGEQEGVVGTYDLILMAIPTKIHEAYKASIQRRINLQQQSQEVIFNHEMAQNIPSKFARPLARGEIPMQADD
jgi:hypothetical protein